MFESLAQLQAQSCRKFSNNRLFGTRAPDGTWEWISYAEFGRLVADLRAALAGKGVSKGDKVAIVSRNSVQWATAAYATWSLGGVFVPMYEAQLSEERRFIVRDSGTKLVFAATKEIADEMAGFVSEIEPLLYVIDLSATDGEGSYASLLTEGREASVESSEVKRADIACLLYTSGTTGEPKGVVLSHSNLCSNVAAAGERFDFNEDDRALCFLPWAHAFGQTAELHTLLSKGCEMAINDEIPNLITNLPEVRPTVLVAVPRIFNRIYDGVNKKMADKPGFVRRLFHTGLRNADRRSAGLKLGALSSLALWAADRILFQTVRARFGGRLRFVVSGSAALSPDVAKFIDALGIDVYEGYGLTETSPVASANYAGHRKFGSVGPAFPGVKIEIDLDATDDPKSGEILISGPNIMQGYHNRPDETAKVLMPDGSFRSGDMGYLDADGFLWITGRIKEQYKLENGKYVVPSPLEEQLKLSPFVTNVMLYGANRTHNVVLVVPDSVELERWAKERGKPLSDVAQDPELQAYVLADLEKYTASFKSYERPKAVAITTEDFSTENGMLTPKLSLKRRAVLAKYQARLEALY